MEAYPRFAEIERMKSERPAVTTVWNVISGVKHVLEATGVPADALVTEMTRQKLDIYLAEVRKRGQSAVTAWAYVQHLRALAARWVMPYYEGEGWGFEPFKLPMCRRKCQRYIRPEREMLLKVRDWYDSLLIRKDKRDWLVVTMMLEFAMRNGDVARLRWSDFRKREGGMEMRDEEADAVYLCYTPHKTELTSGRVVAWPVHPTIWRSMVEIRDQMGDRAGTHFQGLVVPAAKEVFVRLNREIRDCHFFTGTHKALYELRKVCVDHIYQKYGAEKASSISGDDIKTVTRYYADPAQPNIGSVRVVDLL